MENFKTNIRNSILSVLFIAIIILILCIYDSNFFGLMLLCFFTLPVLLIVDILIFLFFKK